MPGIFTEPLSRQAEFGIWGDEPDAAVWATGWKPLF